jgi:archaellum biogenesis ATPase FlaH
MSDFDPVSLLTEQYKVLGHAGLGWTEIRIPKKNVQKFVNNVDDYVNTVLGYCKGDVYVGINPRRTESGSSKDISHVTCIVFDFDPVRPQGSPSTDEQHDEAIRVAADFAHFIDGILVSSGSGAHVYMPVNNIPVVDVKSVSQSLRNFAKQVQETYSTKDIKVDSTFDLPRIIRCWGTFNTKSSRPCYFLSGQLNRRDFRLSDYADRRHDNNSDISGGVYESSNSEISTEETEKHFADISQRNPIIRKNLERKASYLKRAQSDFAFAHALIKEGFTRSEVAILLLRNPLGKFAQWTPHQAEQELNRIFEKCGHDAPKKVVSETYTSADYAKDLESRSPGIMTGFEIWDRMTAGLKGGRFYVVAGRPTEGKTTYLVQSAVNVAAGGAKVLYFPTECTRASIYDKMVSAATEINLSNFQFGRFSQDEKDRIKAVLPGLLKLPIVMAENFRLDYPYVEKMVKQEKPDYVIVDFLNRMNYNDVNSASELGANVMAIKNLGKYQNIPITLAAQLHRKPMGAPKEPSLSDLKGTGKLEEEGDIITFIRTVDVVSYPVHAEACVLKNKFGEPGTIRMLFSRAICKFKEVEIYP